MAGGHRGAAGTEGLRIPAARAPPPANRISIHHLEMLHTLVALDEEAVVVGEEHGARDGVAGEAPDRLLRLPARDDEKDGAAVGDPAQPERAEVAGSLTEL